MGYVERLGGTGVALITPFRRDTSVDYKALEAMTEHVVGGGVDYVVLFGTTSESATLTGDEKESIFAAVKSTIGGRCRLVVGVGGNNTMEIGEKIAKMDRSGVEALLVVSPYYNRPTQEGIYQHYRYLSERSELGIIAYNVPARTGRNMLPETTLRLANEGYIVGIKEASGIMSQVTSLIYNRPEGFVVLSGDDVLTLPILAVGGDGVISVIANAFPFEFSEMTRLALKGDFEGARFYHKLLHEMYKLLFLDGNPGGVKALLSSFSLCENVLRLPLVPVSELVYNDIVAVGKKISDSTR